MSGNKYRSTTTRNLFIPISHKKIMAKNSGVNLPSGFGGLTRYKEEYASVFNLKPAHVILFIILIVAFRIGLGFLFN
jgi:cellulase/cellobiase CelA1